MAKDRPEARIVTRGKPGGKVEVSVYDPKTGRECRTGLHAGNDREADATVRKLARQFEQAGNKVTHKHL